MDAEAKRLGQPRSVFVRRALEEKLEGLGSDQPRSGISAEVPATAAPLARPPASPRASGLVDDAIGGRLGIQRRAPFNVGPKPFAKPIPKGK